MLKYTEYKKEQALWLQRENEARSDGRNSDQFCIDCYWGYLNLIGCKNDEIYARMKYYKSKIDSYWVGRDFMDGDARYFKAIHNRIDKLMDDLVKLK